MQKPNVKEKPIACHVKPSDYPASRLQREHLALLKCVSDTPLVWNGFSGKKPEPGKYYLAISSDLLNVFGAHLDEEPLYMACILDEDNRKIIYMPYEDFTVSRDPHDVMKKKKSFNWMLWNRLKWKEAKAALLDRRTFLYDDNYLVRNRFALVRYPDMADADGDLIPGKQYLAVTQEPDLSPCVYIHILSGDPDAKAKVSIEQFSRFDLLSDPLRLLNPWETDWKKNIELQRELRPDLYRKRA